MNLKNDMIYVAIPGMIPSGIFVACYQNAETEARERAVAVAPVSEKPRKIAKRSWTKAVAHLPRVFDRLVRQPL